jgi:hypothetical protein
VLADVATGRAGDEEASSVGLSTVGFKRSAESPSETVDEAGCGSLSTAASATWLSATASTASGEPSITSEASLFSLDIVQSGANKTV